MTRKRKHISNGSKERSTKNLKITPVESNQSESNQEENSVTNAGIGQKQISCKGPCEKLWDQNKILAHINRNINCRVAYSKEEIEAIKNESKQIADHKRALRRQERNVHIRNNENLRKIQNEKEASKKQKQRKRLKNDDNLRKIQNEKNTSKMQKQRKRIKNDKNLRVIQNAKDASRKQKQRKDDKMNERKRLITFRRECQYGPFFTCICCLRDLFKKTVKKVTPAYFDRLSKTLNVSEYLQIDSGSGNLREDLQVFGNHYVCKNCSRHLERGEMPPICAKNGLEYAEIPSCLQLVNLERQLICKDLVFIKVREMHKSGMSKMNDHVINVPIGDDDIIKTVNALPRTQINNGLVTVGLKRDVAMKNFHKLQKVRPDKVHEAILYLKDNHPSYANIDVSSLDEWHSNFLTGEQEQTKCPGEKEDDACNNENPDDSSQIAEGPKEKSIYNFATCLIPEDPLTDVVGMIYF